MGFFDSLMETAGDVVRVVTAPVEITVDVAQALIKPVANGAQAVVDTVKDVVR